MTMQYYLERQFFATSTAIHLSLLEKDDKTILAYKAPEGK